MEADAKTLELEKRIQKLETRFDNLMRLLAVVNVPFLDAHPPKPKRSQRGHEATE